MWQRQATTSWGDLFFPQLIPGSLTCRSMIFIDTFLPPRRPWSWEDGWRPLGIPKKQTDSLLISGKKSKASSSTPLINMAFVILKVRHLFEQMGCYKTSIFDTMKFRKEKVWTSLIRGGPGVRNHATWSVGDDPQAAWISCFRVKKTGRTKAGSCDAGKVLDRLDDSIMMDFNFSVRISLLILYTPEKA